MLDHLCVTSWRARPVSFVSLMSLYESNYLRLRELVGDVRRHDGTRVSKVAGDCDLHLTVLEHAPYTSSIRLTYVFDDATGSVADPDLEIRVYHDARLAEASACGRWVRHESLEHVRARIPSQLGERWLRNMLLNKWLDYCLERAHEFTPAARVAAHAPA
ncbi:MAG: DUF1249 domain-containing protein [Gammaproteobacteria bacterium]|nr:DUF1249 domain-containing protein [Gammaproteobacteria bacterium]